MLQIARDTSKKPKLWLLSYRRTMTMPRTMSDEKCFFGEPQKVFSKFLEIQCEINKAETLENQKTSDGEEVESLFKLIIEFGSI
jgi:hypothetical protein